MMAFLRDMSASVAMPWALVWMNVIRKFVQGKVAVLVLGARLSTGNKCNLLMDRQSRLQYLWNVITHPCSNVNRVLT